MKQRVKLAQALVHDPVLILLDEPTAGLDPTGRTEMLNLIRRIAREFGISVILSTHLMQDVERTCDNIVLLNAGQVTESSDVKSLTEETESDIRRSRQQPRTIRHGTHRPKHRTHVGRDRDHNS